MRELKMTGRASSLPAGLAIGALISMIITIIVAAIGAHLMISEMVSHEQIGYCSIAALLSGTILGAMVSSRMVKRRRLIVCLLSGLTYSLILLSITALFFGGQYEGVIVTFVTICIGSVAAALLVSRETMQKSKMKRKKSYLKLMQH